MHDELIKRLRNCATQAAPCKTCDMMENVSCTDTLMKQAADAIEELKAEVDAYRKAMTDEHNKAALLMWKYRWIPVKERLPEQNGKYLAFALEEGNTMDFYDGHWMLCGTDYRRHVTHWMPLPELPKDGES